MLINTGQKHRQTKITNSASVLKINEHHRQCQEKEKKSFHLLHTE